MIWHYRAQKRELAAAKAALKKANEDRRFILSRIVEAMDRIGMARSLAVDSDIGYGILDSTVRQFPTAPEPREWKERAKLIKDLRAYAATLPADDARPINIAASRMER